MSEKRKWSKIRRGDVVELGGREWRVLEAKAKKKHVAVVIESGSHRAASKVDPDEKVRVIDVQAREKAAKAQRRADAHKPPAPAIGDPWETQQDRIEKKLDEVLGARLVGEATDAERGYYVPMVDGATVAAHLAIFHGGIPEGMSDEQAMIGHHAQIHVDALERRELITPVHHWHTENRPTTATKKSKKGKKG